MENNNNNTNNYVIPDKLDLNDVNSEEASGFLKRERENIVNATLKVNNSIDEEKVIDVNNTIKVKKNNYILSGVIIFISLIIGTFLIYEGIMLSKNYINSKEKGTNNDTTVLNMHEKVSKYLNNLTKVRKFETSDRIILLLPSSYDLKDNKLFYLNIDKDNNGIIKESYGTYTLSNDELKLDDTKEVFKITEGGISSDEIMLNQYDTEYKFYYYKDKESALLLLINGTIKAETSLFLSSNLNETNIKVGKYEENDVEIKLESNEVFQKDGVNLKINNFLLRIIE